MTTGGISPKNSDRNSVSSLIESSALGAGLWLYETGSPNMGTATAGRAAMARDVTTAASNPAGMTRLDRNSSILNRSSCMLRP